MSKIHRLAPVETAPEKNGDQMIVTLRVAELRDIVRADFEAALAAQRPRVKKLTLSLTEAAEMISVPPTWLAARARAGEIPCVRLGHYVTFTEQDLKEFIAKMRNQTV